MWPLVAHLSLSETKFYVLLNVISSLKVQNKWYINIMSVLAFMYLILWCHWSLIYLWVSLYMLYSQECFFDWIPLLDAGTGPECALYELTPFLMNFVSCIQLLFPQCILTNVNTFPGPWYPQICLVRTLTKTINICLVQNKLLGNELPIYYIILYQWCSIILHN